METGLQIQNTTSEQRRGYSVEFQRSRGERGAFIGLHVLASAISIYKGPHPTVVALEKSPNQISNEAIC